MLFELLVGGFFGAAFASSARERRETEKRRSFPCQFNEGVDRDAFENSAYKAGRMIKRVINISVDGPMVYGTVRSQSGISTWDFSLDFNDYGHITGNYWSWSENNDSDIPNRVASIMNQYMKEYAA